MRVYYVILKKVVTIYGNIYSLTLTKFLFLFSNQRVLRHEKKYVQTNDQKQIYNIESKDSRTRFEKENETSTSIILILITSIIIRI